MAIDQALSEWREILGSEHVLTSDAMRDHYARTTQPRGTRPRAILLPSSVQEVSALVQIASRHSVPLYPISRGKNWGYGDACALTDDQVIVDLSRMNRIWEVNESLAYAVIEPGVTQQQLYQYLVENNYPLWLDVTGAGPEASVVGNTLERGFGHTPYGDHYHMSAGYEVVLADGRILNTGFGHYVNAKATYVFKPGIGPVLDGLFTQSNLGIITKMGIWLFPRPEYTLGFGFSVAQRDDIAKVVEALRPLRLAGLLQSTIHMANDLRALSSTQQYPWEMTGGLTPLPEKIKEKLKREAGLGAWNVFGGLYGTRKTVAASRKALCQALRGIARVRFFNDRTIALAEKLKDMAQLLGRGHRLSRRLRAIKPAFALLKGIPVAEFLLGSAWRSHHPPLLDNLDPLDNNWGFLWLSPLVPMTGPAVLDLLNLTEPIFKLHGFEPLITITSITPRALCCVMTVAYDKDNPQECRQATVCYEELFEVIMEQGYVPYRCGIQSMRKLKERSTVFWDIASSIKEALDPQGILAPGRYI